MSDKVPTNWPDGFRELPDFPAFEAFASALWENQAAVMIGAGFSKLCKHEKNAPSPPLWHDFKLRMESALGYQADKGPDSLRLAEEYRTLHGEHGLDSLIRTLVPDVQWEPGDLHKQLLEFPWQDVLTTNWDTLLERTKAETPDQIYSCVQTVQDIAHQAKPRIVKLHGSMPSHKPFIFTEDDFRTYPTNFAPFVNLAQQVMLENELCLLGFSGDDPNFLAWSGWVRDTLGLSSRRIRLVGVLNLSPASRAMMEARNVTPIDLSPLVQYAHRDDKHALASSLFFQALLASKPPSPFTWPLSEKQNSAHSGRPEADRRSRENIAGAWRNDRMNYPGWIVPPLSESHRIRYDSPAVKTEKEIAEVHLWFAAERVWRRDIAGVWQLETDLEEADHYYDRGQSHLSKTELVDLCTHAARYWRRMQKWPAWTTWVERLSSIETEDAKLAHSYEMGQKAILDWDDEAVLSSARAIETDDPIWMMRKAGLFAALYHHRQAAELYQAALKCIRHKQLAAPRSAWLISLEGWAAMFYRVSQSELTGDRYSFGEEESEKTKMRFLGAKAEPWDVISRLESLASERIDRDRRETTPWELNFEPGSYRPGGTNRNGDDECPFYSLLDVMERVGAPEYIANTNMFSTRMENAYRAVTAKDEDDLMAFLARYRGSERKILNWVLPRVQVAQLSTENVEALLVAIPKRIDRLLGYKERRDEENRITFLLEVLARVVIRAGEMKALSVFHWVANTLNLASLSWGSYAACGAVLEAATEPMGENTKTQALEIALQIKTPKEAGVSGIEREWPEPIDVFSGNEVQRMDVSHRLKTRIDDLLEISRSAEKLDRTRAIRRLHLLYKGKRLSAAQTQALQDAIWSRTTDTGWPADTDLHPWIFLDLPTSVNVKELFNRTVVDSIADGSVSHNMLMNLRVAVRTCGLELEETQLVSCLQACLSWKPKNTDGRSRFSIAMSGDVGDNRATSREIGDIVARTLLPRMEAGSIPSEVKELLLSEETHQRIPPLVAAARQIERIWPDRAGFALQVLRKAVASRDPRRVYPAFVAMMQYTKPDGTESESASEVVEILLHAAEHRIQPGLSNALLLLADLLKLDALSGFQRSRVVEAIPVILEEYKYDQRKLEVPSMADLPLVRKHVHQLVLLLADDNPSLSVWGEEMRDDPLPEVRKTATSQSN